VIEDTVRQYLALVPVLRQLPVGVLSASYDRDADVVYINFGERTLATDSELTADDVILRYQGDDLVGLTVLHASQR
jgi:uncharacterized protein YuzE